MARVNLKVEAQLTPAQMRKLNPHLRQKGLTVQQAVEKGPKERTPAMYLNLTAFLAAIEGVGVTLKRDPLTGRPMKGV